MLSAPWRPPLLGLPASLVPPETSPATAKVENEEPRFALKALGITTSALAAEIQQLAAPVSVLSRPTESQNQDVVSMGTISARKLQESLHLCWHIVAHSSVITAQAARIAGIKHPLLSKLEQFVPAVSHNQAIGRNLHDLADYMQHFTPDEFCIAESK